MPAKTRFGFVFCFFSDSHGAGVHDQRAIRAIERHARLVTGRSWPHGREVHLQAVGILAEPALEEEWGPEVKRRCNDRCKVLEPSTRAVQTPGKGAGGRPRCKRGSSRYNARDGACPSSALYCILYTREHRWEKKIAAIPLGCRKLDENARENVALTHIRACAPGASVAATNNTTGART